jgi:hypothetical protein
MSGPLVRDVLVAEHKVPTFEILDPAPPTAVVSDDSNNACIADLVTIISKFPILNYSRIFLSAIFWLAPFSFACIITYIFLYLCILYSPVAGISISYFQATQLALLLEKKSIPFASHKPIFSPHQLLLLFCAVSHLTLQCYNHTCHIRLNPIPGSPLCAFQTFLAL